MLKRSAFRCYPEKYKNKKKNQKKKKNHELKISSISLALRTRENADIFNTFDEIYLVFTSKK